MLFNCKYATHALPIRAFTSASDPPSSLMVLLKYVKITKTSKSQAKHEIQRTACMRLDDLDIVSDLALLSHIQKQTQVNTTSVAAVFAPVGFNIHKGKRSSNTARTTSTQSYLMEKLWKKWKLSHTRLSSSVN
ncbi:unnamed protein product [Schistosoma mattheei]|uniref:Uncharacterized protein n=1 Tax=Schistosoma mattheei TaxID=31246 RepID=A0A183PFE6_9TREM|nr:unnamed protein product [Schistosoma mattheei]